MKAKFLLAFFLIIISLGWGSIVHFRSPRFTIDQKRWPAEITGYVQTPIGGSPGSSDLKRPTFAELGVKNFAITDNLLSVEWQGFIFYAGLQEVAPKGETVLTKPLLTYGKVIPVNTFFKSETRFNWYRFGIAIPVINLAHLKWLPKLEVALLDFNYHFKTATLDKARGYRHVTLRSGSEFIYHPAHFSGAAIYWSKMESVPFFKVLNIQSSNLYVNYLPLATAVNQQQEQISFEDGQALPNHLYLNASSY